MSYFRETDVGLVSILRRTRLGLETSERGFDKRGSDASHARLFDFDGDGMISEEDLKKIIPDAGALLPGLAWKIWDMSERCASLLVSSWLVLGSLCFYLFVFVPHP